MTSQSVTRSGCAARKLRARFFGIIAAGLSCAVSTAVAQAPASDPSNSGGWLPNATFSDEFNDGVFDTNKWFNQMSYWDGRAPSWFKPANVWEGTSSGVQGVFLRTAMETMPGDSSRTISAAAVQSKTKAHYGYYEVRAKMANAANSSSFWFHSGPASGSTPATEIDVFEATGNANINLPEWRDYNTWLNNQISTNTHVHFSEPVVDPEYQDVGARVADAFHTYGMEWSSSQIKWYVDGALRRTYNHTSLTAPEYLILDTEVHVGWFGTPTTEQLPSWFVVDYVRAWTKNANVRSGAWAMRQAATATPTYGGSYQQVSGCSANSSYAFEAWIKGVGQKIRLAVYNASWQLVTQSAIVASTGSWSRVSTPSFPTGATCNFFVQFIDAGNTAGNTYVDDAYLGSSDGVNRLANGGFESGNAAWVQGSPFSILQPL